MIGNLSIILEDNELEEAKQQQFHGNSFFNQLNISNYLSNASFSSISSAACPETLDTDRITGDNKKIKKLVHNRLKRFVRASKRFCEEELADLKFEQESTGSGIENIRVDIKSVLEKIVELEKEEEMLRSRLKRVKSEVRLTEEEESENKYTVLKINEDYKRFIIETNEEIKPGCMCLMF